MLAHLVGVACPSSTVLCSPSVPGSAAAVGSSEESIHTDFCRHRPARTAITNLQTPRHRDTDRGEMVKI